jgi:hypothetical protein
MNTQRMHTPAGRVIAALALLATAGPAPAQIILASNFESGLSGWTVLNQLGSEGTFFSQSGTTSPASGFPVPAPPDGSFAAMTDAQGPGSHVLYQDFTVPSTPIPGARLRFDAFVGNRANDFFRPNLTTLDFSTPALNQQARVDIMTTTADPFSIAPSDILMTVFQTPAGGPLVTGYGVVDVDVLAVFAANPGATLRLRFAEVDNVAAFQFGIDNVVIAVPEPSALVLSAVALAFIRRARRAAGAEPTRKEAPCA